MMTVLKSNERGHFENSWLNSYHTFSFGSYYNPEHIQFGALRVINQDIIAGDSGFDFHPHKDMEIFTYVLSGELEHKDNMGNKEKIRPNEVQIMSAGTGVLHSEYNPSAKEAVELLQIWVVPEKYGIKPRYDQKKFTLEEKKNAFKLVISPEGTDGSLKIFQKAWVWGSVFTEGFEKKFEVKNGKDIWLHVANGEIEVNGKRLAKGDAISFEGQTNFNVKGIGHFSEFVTIELG